MTTWICLMLMAFAPAAHAQDGDAPDTSDDSLVIEDGAIVVRGKVQKPEIVVVITRDTLAEGFDLRLRESFLPDIVEALDEDPF